MGSRLDSLKDFSPILSSPLRVRSSGRHSWFERIPSLRGWIWSVVSPVRTWSADMNQMTSSWLEAVTTGHSTTPITLQTIDHPLPWSAHSNFRSVRSPGGAGCQKPWGPEFRHEVTYARVSLPSNRTTMNSWRDTAMVEVLYARGPTRWNPAAVESLSEDSTPLAQLHSQGFHSLRVLCLCYSKPAVGHSWSVDDNIEHHMPGEKTIGPPAGRGVPKEIPYRGQKPLGQTMLVWMGLYL